MWVTWPCDRSLCDGTSSLARFTWLWAKNVHYCHGNLSCNRPSSIWLQDILSHNNVYCCLLITYIHVSPTSSLPRLLDQFNKSCTSCSEGSSSFDIDADNVADEGATDWEDLSWPVWRLIKLVYKVKKPGIHLDGGRGWGRVCAKSKQWM